MIETLVVDLGGVAARFRPERRLDALATLSGLSAEAVRARLFDSGLEAQAERGVFARDRIVRLISDALGAEIEEAQLLEAWSQAFDLDTAVLAVVEASPLPAAIFTNNGPMLDLCLNGPLNRLAGTFAQVICSWHLGICKPEAMAFQLAADRLGVSADRLLLVDDSLANVNAAIACGWNARQVTDAQELEAALASFGAESGRPSVT